MGVGDALLFGFAVCAATYGLARLMVRRRDQLLQQFRGQMEQGLPAKREEKGS